FTAFVVVGCSGETQTEQGEVVAPTTTELTGYVDVMFPMSGSIIYSETILLEGSAADLPAEGFELVLFTPDDTVIAQTTVQPAGDTWSVELVPDYTGDPTELTVMARPVGGDGSTDYDIESLLLSSLAQRPEGAFGQITVPQADTTIGGDTIPVSGRGSGFFENSFVIILEDNEGNLISETPVTMQNPNFVDEMPWETEIPRNDYVGIATLRMAYQDAESGEMVTVDSVEVTVTEVAG
ncbi:MAG: Gmad2 immunoglobulin-like domain-containing protein, partial [Chloroflexota bacterium]